METELAYFQKHAAGVLVEDKQLALKSLDQIVEKNPDYSYNGEYLKTYYQLCLKIINTQLKCSKLYLNTCQNSKEKLILGFEELENAAFYNQKIGSHAIDEEIKNQLSKYMNLFRRFG